MSNCFDDLETPFQYVMGRILTVVMITIVVGLLGSFIIGSYLIIRDSPASEEQARMSEVLNQMVSANGDREKITDILWREIKEQYKNEPGKIEQFKKELNTREDLVCAEWKQLAARAVETGERCTTLMMRATRIRELEYDSSVFIGSDGFEK